MCELAIVERTQIERGETELGYRVPSESLVKHTQQHLSPLLLDNDAALGVYSADVIVGAEK